MSSRSGRRSRRTGAADDEDIELQDAQLRRELEEVRIKLNVLFIYDGWRG